MKKKKVTKKTRRSNQEIKNKQIVEEEHPFAVAINDFVDDIESIESSLFQVIMQSLYKDHEKKRKAFDSFIKKKAKKSRNGHVTVQLEYFSEFEEKYRAARHGRMALESVPKSIFVMLISHLDNHFKKNLKIILSLQKGLIDGTEKNISVSELFEMRTIEDAKAYVLDRELDDILSTRIKYFNWLKTKLKIDVQFSEVVFGRLHEMTERRNALVHSEGIFTQRYADVCKKNKITFIQKPGDTIDISSQYFMRSFMVTYIIGVISTHIIWRTLQPNKLKESDENLNEKIVELLNRSRYGIAYELAKFANSLSTFSSEESRLMFIINESLTLKFLKKQKEAVDLIKKIDWSATKDEFKLAVAIIEGKLFKAREIMIHIGANKEMKGCYEYWPLFKEFRKTKLFRSTYKLIYKEDHITTTNPISDLKKEI